MSETNTALQINYTLLFSCSVVQLCQTPCDPVDCSTPCFLVLHYLTEFAQTCVY